MRAGARPAPPVAAGPEGEETTPCTHVKADWCDQVGLSVIPMFHIFGLVFNVLQPLSAGARMVSLPQFTPELFLSSLAAHQPTHCNLVPPLLALLASLPDPPLHRAQATLQHTQTHGASQ